MFKKIIVSACIMLAAVGGAVAQSGQLGAGQVVGNAGATAAPGKPSTVTAILDRALGSTRGAIIERGVSGWAIIGPGTINLPFVSGGAGADPSYQVLGFAGGGTGATSAAGVRTALSLVIGTNVEAWDADLDCLAALAGTGILRRTGAGTCSNGTTVSIAEGGTGQGTQQASFNALAPTPTRAGDLIYYNGTNWISLAGNNSGTKLLQEDASGAPSWVVAPGTGTVTSVTCGAGLTGGTFTTVGTCAVDYATKSDQQTGTATAKTVNPSLQQQHDSAAKAWVSFGTTGTISAAYNVTTVSNPSTGVYTVNLSPTAFATVNYACTTMAANAGYMHLNAGTKATSSFQVVARDNTGAAAQIGGDVICFGRQ